MTIMTELTTDLMKIKRGGDELVQTGNEHLITVFEGWRGMTMRRSTSERLTGDGDLSERGTKAGRVLTVGGESVFNTELEAEQFALQLQRFLADGQVGIVEVEEVTLGKTLQLAVELNTLDEPIVMGNTVAWNYELYAADPAKYGTPEVFEPETMVVPGQPIYETLAKNEVRVYNRGTSAAPVYYKTTSNWASPIITDLSTGLDVRSPGLLVNTGMRFEHSASPRYLRNYQISNNSYSDYTSYMTGTPPTIPAGSSRVFRLTNLDSTADSGTNEVFLSINVVGSTEVFSATYKKGSNPTYQTQTGTTAPSESYGNTIVTNNGTMTTRAKFTITGSFPEGVSVFEANSGKTVTVYGAVNATASVPLVIDSNKGKATLGGVDISTRLTERQWVDIAPGSTASFQLAGAGMTNTKLVGEVETKWN